MKIALAQTDIKWEDKTYNQAICSRLISEAAQNKADFAAFPEMTLTGFSTNIAATAESFENSPSIEFFRHEAAKNNIHIGFGLVTKSGARALNKFIIISPSGKIICDYSKIHPFSYGLESKYFDGGNALCSCSVSSVIISPLICYDLRFPEIFQLCSDESDLIVVTANWPVQRRAHWITLLKARAVENQCYVAGVNRCGREFKNDYSGDSMVVNPYGEIITKPLCGEGVVLCDIDSSIVKKYREEFRLKEDRRNALYAEMYSEKLQK